MCGRQHASLRSSNPKTHVLPRLHTCILHASACFMVTQPQIYKDITSNIKVECTRKQINLNIKYEFYSDVHTLLVTGCNIDCSDKQSMSG